MLSRRCPTQYSPNGNARAKVFKIDVPNFGKTKLQWMNLNPRSELKLTLFGDTNPSPNQKFVRKPKLRQECHRVSYSKTWNVNQGFLGYFILPPSFQNGRKVEVEKMNIYLSQPICEDCRQEQPGEKSSPRSSKEKVNSTKKNNKFLIVSNCWFFMYLIPFLHGSPYQISPD